MSTLVYQIGILKNELRRRSRGIFCVCYAPLITLNFNWIGTKVISKTATTICIDYNEVEAWSSLILTYSSTVTTKVVLRAEWGRFVDTAFRVGPSSWPAGCYWLRVALTKGCLSETSWTQQNKTMQAQGSVSTNTHIATYFKQVLI